MRPEDLAVLAQVMYNAARVPFAEQGYDFINGAYYAALTMQRAAARRAGACCLPHHAEVVDGTSVVVTSDDLERMSGYGLSYIIHGGHFLTVSLIGLDDAVEVYNIIDLGISTTSACCTVRNPVVCRLCVAVCPVCLMLTLFGLDDPR